MIINARKKMFFLAAILLFVFSASLTLASADQTAASAAIASAKEHILTCYKAAEEAEGAGANVTALVAVLNDAGWLLSRAEFAYSVSDFDVARDFAVQSKSTLGNFVSEANALKENATKLRTQDFLINVVGSIIGTFVILGAGFVVWIFLKRKYETVGMHENGSSGV